MDTVTISRKCAERAIEQLRMSIYSADQLAADEIKAALTSTPDEGWVRVDEVHSLPDDLTIGDRIKVRGPDASFPPLPVTIDDLTTTGGRVYYCGADKIWKREAVTAYRRRSQE